MSEFRINNENTEDTFDATDNLQDAIRIAREVAQHGPAGEFVCIEHKGMNIRQFVLMPNGKVAEADLLTELPDDYVDAEDVLRELEERRFDEKAE